MPIFEYNGVSYRVKDEHIDKFAEKYPDAYAHDSINGEKYKVKPSRWKAFAEEKATKEKAKADEDFLRSQGIGEETIRKGKEILGLVEKEEAPAPQEKKTFEQTLEEAEAYDMNGQKDAPNSGLTNYVPGDIISKQKQTPLYAGKNLIGERLQKDTAPKYSGKSFDEVWREAGAIEGEKNSTPAPQVPQEYADTFGEGFIEGSKSLGYGIENAAAETVGLVTGGKSDYDTAKDMLLNLRRLGLNPSDIRDENGDIDADLLIELYNVDADKYLATKSDRDRAWNKHLQEVKSRYGEEEARRLYNDKKARILFDKSVIAPNSTDRRGVLDAIDESVNPFSADKSKKIRASRKLQKALTDAGGDYDRAMDMLIIRKGAADKTLADRLGEDAREGLRNIKPTKGFGAWVGNLAPQMAGNVLALAAATNPYTRQLSKPLGMANMGMLTASTAGSSMATARDYAEEHGGVSEGDIWRTGIVDGAVEFLTEKIPFDRYIGRVSNLGVKGIGGNVASKLGNQAVDAELDKLLSRGRKELGGKFWTSKMLKNYIGDMTAEGASEFVAGFLQTLTPIMYQNPEDYPTLMDAVAEGWEGAKGGLFMGGFLGAGSNVISNRANRERRREQGSVIIADAGDKGLVELLSPTEDGHIALDANGNEIRLSANEVLDYAVVSFDEFDTGVRAKRTAQAQTQGREAVTLEQVRAVGKSIEDAESALLAVNGGDAIKQTIDRHIADGATDARQMSAVFGALDEDARQSAEDYFFASVSLQGKAEEVQSRIDAKVKEKEDEIAPYIYNNESGARMYAKATLTTGQKEDKRSRTIYFKDYDSSAEKLFYYDEEGKVQMIARNDAELSDLQEINYDEYINQYREEVSNMIDSAEDAMLSHSPKTIQDIKQGTVIETAQGQMIAMGVAEDGTVTLLPAKMDKSGQIVPVEGQPITMSMEDAMRVQDEFYETPSEAVLQSTESVDNMSANQVHNESIANGESEQSVSKPTIEPIPTIQNGKKSRVAYEQVPVARTIEEVYGQFDEQEEVDEFIDLNIAEAEAAVKNASKPKPKMSTDIEAYKQAKAKWQEEQAGLAEAQKRLDYWKEVKAESERMQGLDTVTEIPQETKKVDNAPRSAMEYVASMIGRLDPESYRKETGYGVKEQRKAGPIFLKKENGGMTVEGLAEYICEQPEAQEWGIQPGMDSEVRDMIIEVLSYGSPKAYIRDAHAQQAKADAYGEEQYLENMAAAQGYASADDMIAHDEVFLAEAIRAHYGLDENEYYANLAEEYEQEDNRKYGQGNERQDNGTSAERLGQGDTTAEVADVSGSSEVLSEEQSADTAGAESGNEQGELSGSTEGGNEGVAENEAVSGESVAQEQDNFIPYEEQMKLRIEQWEKALGVKVVVYTDPSQVKSRTVRAEWAKGEMTAGWFSNGTAYIFLPHNNGVESIDKTFVHEVVSHKGIKELLGEENFNKFLDKVWDMMSAESRAEFLGYVNGKEESENNRRAAVDEYVAHLSEGMIGKLGKELSSSEKGIWKKIVDFFRNLFASKNKDLADAILSKEVLTDKDIEQMIMRSFESLREKAKELSRPIQETNDTDDLLEYAKRDAERREMLRKVYHGSGASFDKFDHSHMGEGEGAQAFGWGTYVTDVEGIGRTYARSSAKGGNITYDGKPLGDVLDNTYDDVWQFWKSELLRATTKEELKSVISKIYIDVRTASLRSKRVREFNAQKKKLLADIDNGRIEIIPSRHLYTVEIPDDNGSNYIVYDKDVSKKVKDNVKRSLFDILVEGDYKGAEKELKWELDDVFATEMDGRDLYGTVSSYLGSDKEASQFFNSIGFVGISYPAEFTSGGRSDGARNYVIFNEEDAKIEGHIMFRKLKEVNDKFNARLLELDRDREQKDRVLRLGKPSQFLLDGGVVDADMEMEFDKFVRKSSDKYENGHPFTANDIMDLPMAINYPIAVFDSTNGRDKVILTELKKDGMNFIVAIKAVPRRRKGGVVLEVNEIATLYPKKAKGIVNWINNGLTANIEKKKALEWLEALRTNHGTELNNQELDSATKVIEDFVNPKLSEENEETKFKKYKSKDGKETAYRQLSLFDTEGETTNDRLRSDSVQRKGDTTLSVLNHLRELEDGEVCNVERKFSEKGGFDFTRGEEVLFVEDVAYIFKNLEGEAIENSFAAFVKGDEVTVMHVGMGAQTMTVADQIAVIAGAERLNADKVFFVHNHPSGKLVCSREDINTYTSLKMALGDKLWDGIIINTRSGKYGVFNENGIVSSGEEHISPQKEYPLKIYGFNKQAFHGDVVNIEPSSAGIAEFVSTQRLGSRNKINALLLDNNFGCVGNVFLSETDITEKNAYPVMQKLVADAISMGARGIVLYGRAPFVYFAGGKLNLGSRLSEYVKMLSSGQIQLQDVIQLGEGSYTSAIDDGIRFRKANRNQVGFVSNAMVAVEGVKQDKATPEQWLKMIEKQGGLKAGEDKWLGLSDWLKSSDKKTLTKDEVLEFIGENMIQIEEVKYKQDTEADYADKLAEFNAEFDELIGLGEEETESIYTSDWVDYAWSAMLERYGDDFESAFEVEGNGTNARLVPQFDYDGSLVGAARYFLDIEESNSINSTRLDYTTEGLENKREIALTVPTIESWNESDEIHFGDAGDGRAVAWIRFGETTDAGGSKVLVIDEIQSKRHQEGRENGYKDLKDFTVEKQENGIWHILKNGELVAPVAAWKAQTEEEALKEYAKSLIPSAPFEKNWHELAMKRMLRLAAEEGFDKVAWTTGAQQAERYNIGDSVERITSEEYGMDEEGNRTTLVDIEPHGEMNNFRFEVNSEGIIIDGDREYEGKPLSDIVGKEIANKLMQGSTTISGQGLHIGGEGMKGFYDKMLPSFVQKYTKKWGAKVGDVTLPNLEESAQKMWSVDVTPQMKESVGEQVMFSKKPAEIEAEKAKLSRPVRETNDTDDLVEYAKRDARRREELRAMGIVGRYAKSRWCAPVTVLVDEEDAKEKLSALGASSELIDNAVDIIRGDILAGGYNNGLKRIFIFAGNSEEEIDITLKHENTHAVLDLLSEDDFNALYDALKSAYPKTDANIRKRYLEEFPDYTERQLQEELVTLTLEYRNIDSVRDKLSDKGLDVFNNVVEIVGYEQKEDDSSRRGRTDSRAGEGSGSTVGGTAEEANRETEGVNENSGSESKGQPIEGKDEQMVKLRKVVTPEMDAEYMDAVERGDMKKVQRMVKEAAKLAMPDTKVVDKKGNPLVVYHGTPSEDIFYDFDLENGGGMIFLSSSASNAEEYTHRRGQIGINPKQTGRVMPVFVNLKNPLIVDANKRLWRNITVDWSSTPVTTRDIALYAKENGYDGVIIKKVRDHLYDDDKRYADVVIAFNRSQVKSAGPTYNKVKRSHFPWDEYESLTQEIGATYDDNGNVIPLSERFNEEKSDIRFRKTSAGFDAVAYAQQKVKEREDEVKFRRMSVDLDKAEARRAYESMLDTEAFRFQEAFQDSMLGLKALQEAVGKANGKSEIADWENAYMAENQLSSINHAEQEAWRRLVLGKLLGEVKSLMKEGATHSEISDYLMAKHGLERNEKFADRDAREVATDKDGNLDMAAYQNELQKNREDDYSGLTTMFETEDVAEAERLAREFVNQFEKDHDTKNLWSAVKGATKSILDKQLESGLINKETYDLTDKMFEWYVPLRGFDEKTSDEVYDYLDKGSIRSTLSMPIRHAKGRGSKADDPIATIANMAESGIMVGNKNVMKQRFLNLVENNPTDLVSVDDVWVEKRFNPTKNEDEWVQVLPDYTGLTTAEEIEQARATFEASMEARHKADPKSVLRGREAEKVPYKVVTSKQMNEHQVVVKRGGKTYVLTINGNPRAAQALNGLTNPHGSNAAVPKALGALNRWLASMFTSRNPAFIFANLVRDGIYANQSVWAKEPAAYAIKYNQNWNKALASLPKLIKLYKQDNLDLNNPEHKMFYDFITNGGETGYSKLTSVEEYKKHIAAELGEGKRNALKVLDKGLDTFNRWAEGVSRYSAFKTSREMGRSVQRSIYDAKEISVNFNKKGGGSAVAGEFKGWNPVEKGNRQHLYAYASQGARMLYVFWNAGVQGLTNFGKIAKKNPKKFLAWAGTQFVAGACMPLINSVLASMFGDDDDDYWNIPEYIRRNNVCIFNPVTGGYIKIPMPIELRAIYGLGELMAGQMLGKTDFKGMELTKQVAGQVSQMLPIDMMEGDGGIMAFVPTAFKPIAEILANKDWTGIPLKKDYDYNKNMPEWTKAYKGTSPWLVGLSEAVNDWTGGNKYKKGAIDIDPSAVQHLFEGYFGGVGKMISQTFDTASLLWSEDMREGWTWGRHAPIINRFYTSSDKRAEEKRITSDWWMHKDRMDIFGQQLRGFERDIDNASDPVEVAKAKDEYFKLVNSEENAQYMVWKDYDKDIREINELLNDESVSTEAKDNLKDEKQRIMKEMNDIFKIKED